MKRVTFIFYDHGYDFISLDNWIPGDLKASQKEVWPGQAANFCAELYTCVVRKGVEALMEGTIDLLPVFIHRYGETMLIHQEVK